MLKTDTPVRLSCDFVFFQLTRRSDDSPRISRKNTGAIEAGLAMTLKSNAIPPIINLTHPGPNSNLDYVPRTAREQRVQTAVSTSSGFGGQNGALMMRQFTG
jgi:hypothetical protein